MICAAVAAFAVSTPGFEAGATERRQCADARVLAAASLVALHAVRDPDPENAARMSAALSGMVERLREISRAKVGRAKGEALMERVAAAAAALAEAARRDGRRGLVEEFDRSGAADLVTFVPGRLMMAFCGAQRIAPQSDRSMTHAPGRPGETTSERRDGPRTAPKVESGGVGAAGTTARTMDAATLAMTGLATLGVAAVAVAVVALADRSKWLAEARHPVTIDVKAFVGGRHDDGHIHDLSRLGATLSLRVILPAEGAVIIVRVGDIMLQGRIVRSAMRQCGMKFDAELSGALLKKLLRLGSESRARRVEGRSS